MSEVTQILNSLERNDPSNASQLLPLVYHELRSLAKRRLAQEQPGQTLQATALVHEAYMRLVGGQNREAWENRSQFFAAASEAMRRILVDQARQKKSLKRGNEFHRLEMSDSLIVMGDEEASPDDLLALDAALEEFEMVDPERARVVKLRYFSGFTLDETADAMGISLATVKRHWVFARSWLFGKINGR